MISVVVLTFNEEANLRYTLQSVQGFSADVHVVDSFSTDSTLAIAREFDVKIHQNQWNGWAAQRNWAQQNCALAHPWVLYLDADEILTEEAKEEILQRVARADSGTVGFYLKFDFWFLGHRISKAMVPHLRLVRHEQVSWHAEGAREYNSAPKDSPTIQAHLIHRDNRDLTFWATSFVRKAKMESEYVHTMSDRRVEWSKMFRKGGLKPQLRSALFRFMPPFLRVLPIFLYRMLFHTRLRDGWPAIQYNILISLWYPLLVDCFYLEKKLKGRK